MVDKVLLVTGGSRGIGRSIALLAAQRGWSVGVNYTAGADAAEEVLARIKGAGGRGAAIQGDVSRENDVIRMFDEITAQLGAPTGLVNNAGINLPRANIVDMTAERMMRIFSVNTVGAYLCAREAARRMSKSRGGQGGSIVNISSVAARMGSPNEYVDYAGSKAAVDAMTIGLSKELGPEGIRVNAVRPGLTDTDIHQAAGDPERIARTASSIPLGRAGSPDEVAQAAVWLLGDDASYVTGALLDAGGGR
jgi:NAD(P)-dependent dehydrogenase (short-subunit alcohol dehydrogenase family)